jgi:hypothetical protein
MIANWQKIYKNNFFSGNYDHFRTPRTDIEAKVYAMTQTWFRAKRAVSDKEEFQISLGERTGIKTTRSFNKEVV